MLKRHYKSAQGVSSLLGLSTLSEVLTSYTHVITKCVVTNVDGELC